LILRLSSMEEYPGTKGFIPANHQGNSDVFAVLEEENRRLRKQLESAKKGNMERSEEITRLSNLLAVLEPFTDAKIQSYSSKFRNEYVAYRLRGVGGGGFVYGAVNKFDQNKYAVKRIAVEPSEEVIDIALREVRAMANLNHPQIVRFHSTWIEKPPEGWQVSFWYTFFS
ncbi:hypothetical protein PMAYCL1PPCAC_01304, partial [Pristionchus mayeri]